MPSDLAYAMITPYSLLKSRTGGIIGRLLSIGNAELIAARMYAPSNAFVDEYASTIRTDKSINERMRLTLLRYLDENLRPSNRLGRSNRVMILVFRGENAVREMRDDVAGPLTTDPRGDTVRGTYGEFVSYPSGEVIYFEPAVLIGPSEEVTREHLGIFARHAESDGGVLDKLLRFPPGTKVETTLVMLKPDLFAQRSAKPGNIIDMFSRTGLYIVGARVLHLSVAQAMEFYGPLRKVFVERLKFIVEQRLKKALDGALPFALGDGDISKMADLLKDRNAEAEFNKIVEYMAGVSPADVPEGERSRAGKSKCLALLYQGENAIGKIRDKLGPTDPSKAPGGSVRRDYGADLMHNGAHASDSVESAERERRIVGLAGGEASDLKQMLLDYLGSGS